MTIEIDAEREFIENELIDRKMEYLSIEAPLGHTGITLTNPIPIQGGWYYPPVYHYLTQCLKGGA